MAKRRSKTEIALPTAVGYDVLIGGISELLELSRRAAARTVNSVLTATYWEIGQRIVEFEQGGRARAEYGAELLKRLAADLTARFGRGFSKSNLFQMRVFYLGWEMFQTPSGIFEARAKVPAELLEGGKEIRLEVSDAVARPRDVAP